MNSLSPFSTIRFEHEGPNSRTYYLPPDVFPRLEKKCPAYLIGTRGTGKTTLLMALNWKNRLRDPNLRSQFPGDPFASRYIGVYLKLPEYHIQKIDQWTESDDSLRNHFVSLYLEMLWSQLMIDGVISLRGEGVIGIEGGAEIKFVRSIKEELTSSLLLAEALTGRRRSTLSSLMGAIRDAREELDRLALARFDPSDALRFFPTRAPGAFVALIASKLSQLCDSAGSSGWHFKVCMDEGECLTPSQQLLLSTIIRTCSFPFLPIASFVDVPASEDKTLFRSLTLQRADRELINLNEEGFDFAAFAEGVATRRVRAVLGSDYSFSCTRTFGKLDLNALLTQTLSDSESLKAKELLKSARDTQPEGDESVADPETEDDRMDTSTSQSPPIIRTYIDQRIHPRGEGDQGRWGERRRESQTYRKMMVSAYLSIFAELNASPRYAYDRMVLGMSDRCIRDFLLQIEEVFAGSDVDLLTFVTRHVPILTQSKQLRLASKRKFEDLKSWVLHSHDRVNSLVKGLAWFTASIQSSGPGSRQLKTSESGRFVLNRSEDLRLEGTEESQAGVSLSDVVRDAAQAGYLRLLLSDEQKIVFRVHASLAAHFGFSYRGAMYNLNVRGDDLKNLMAATSDTELRYCVNSMVKREWGEPDQYPLFEGERP